MDYLAINKASWDKRTLLHVESEFYDVKGFVAGKSSLNPIELEALGDVSGKTLLHLQCHFGLDTLSWARLEAKVTGVDLSSNAIEQAKMLAHKIGVDGQFICSDLYDFANTSEQEFDLVFTSYGAICWLPDLTKWAELIFNNLKPGGTFYMAEFHPFYDVLSGYPYFYQTEPDVEQEGTYTENDDGELSTVVTWAHPISEVLNTLLKAGLTITQFNEYPFSPYNCFSDMEQREPGKFYLQHQQRDIPLVYSIKATKPD